MKGTVDSGKGKSIESERSDGISLVDFKLPQRSALVVAMPCAAESPESALEALGGYGTFQAYTVKLYRQRHGIGAGSGTRVVLVYYCSENCSYAL